ncbi:Gfo/Idh/MocA family oxidoreductase [Rubrolithibacter danxiaensis]|uniref:Gfo/Idh/MocA family oxidoreductase n=1 Tax=Rubrolithibacter danxiaensis TaxID=3390805 RepID=UPI003BF89E87
MNNPIITGILSYGMSGKLFHAPFIYVHPGFELYAVTERHEKNASKRYQNIKSYNSVDELIADPAIELVIVNTPNNTHYEFTKKALLAGKHVLVEKPFTPTVAEAKELFKLADETGKKIMVYQNRRYNSDFLSVIEAIKSNKLGKLIELHIRFDRYRNAIGPKKFKETPVAGSGLAYDLGAHLLDQAICLFGKPLSFTKTKGIYRKDSQVDDYVTFHLVYPEQVNVFLTASMLVVNPLPSYVINGSLGTFIKDRTDVQEDQLIKEILPSDPGFGIEDQGKEGLLSWINENGNKENMELPSLKGKYMDLFSDIYNHIRLDVPYPIKQEEIIWQLEMLEQE